MIPIAMFSIVLAVFVTISFFFKFLFEAKKWALFLQSVNFDFSSMWNFNYYILERTVFHFFSNPIVLFVLLFVVVLMVYLNYASKKVGRSFALIINVPLFFLLFAVLFAFWWTVSIFYAIFAKQVKWR